MASLNPISVCKALNLHNVTRFHGFPLIILDFAVDRSSIELEEDQSNKV